MVEIEIGSAQCRDHYFFPLKRKLRGRIDLARLNDPGIYPLRQEYPDPIPGLRIKFDAASGTASLLDPLYAAEYDALRKKIADNKLSLGPAREDFSNVHAPTWAHWIRRAVDSGNATIISGKLPDVIGEPHTTQFPQFKSEQAKLVDKLVDLLATALKLPESKRKALAGAL